MFGDATTWSVQTIGTSGNLLVIKAIARRVLVQCCIPLCNQFHQAAVGDIKELNICMYGTKVILVSIAKFPICNNNSYRLIFLF